jgi:O-antigen ligase
LTGVGPGNFGQVSSERVGNWLNSRGEPFVTDRYFHSNHAHSLYFNTLAERGLLGGMALLLLAAVWLRRLMFLPGLTTMRSQRSRLIWGCGMAGFVGIFCAGLFNTTLHHENGLLAMFALGLLLMDDRMAHQQWNQGK